MSQEFDQFEMALQAYQELTGQSIPEQSLPHLTRSTSGQGRLQPAALPPETLFLGIATDGLPILLDLKDPSPGALLIAAETGAGKTTFLKAVIHTIDSEQVRFCVLTASPEEWDDLADSPSCLGIFSPYEAIVPAFLSDLAVWAREQRRAGEWSLFLLDDLTLADSLPLEARQTLRWILVRGPQRGLWPIVTLDTAQAEQVLPWLAAFRTRVLGRVRKRDQAEAVTGTAWNPSLETGQFALQQGRQWLKFSGPQFDESGG